jgi:hypothetical protein
MASRRAAVQPHPFDLLFLVASLAMIAWVVLPR